MLNGIFQVRNGNTSGPRQNTPRPWWNSRIFPGKQLISRKNKSMSVHSGRPEEKSNFRAVEEITRRASWNLPKTAKNIKENSKRSSSNISIRSTMPP